MLALSTLYSVLRSPLAGLIGSLISLILLILATTLGFKLVHANLEARHLRGQLKTAESQRALAVMNFTTCKTNTTSLQAALKTQNDSILAAAHAEQARKADAQKAVDNALASAAAQKARFDKLINQQPASGRNRCEAAGDLIDSIVH